MVCKLCPRECGVKRLDDAGCGICGKGTSPVLARAGLHMWEEPCISGSRGTGAVFFSGCPLKCVFCQNYEISEQGFGKSVSTSRLREIFSKAMWPPSVCTQEWSFSSCRRKICSMRTPAGQNMNCMS